MNSSSVISYLKNNVGFDHRKHYGNSPSSARLDKMVPTLQTAACKMASNPPSGASRLPDIFSSLSSLVKKLTLLVSVMTF